MCARTHIITYAIYIQAPTTHTLHTLNKTINNVYKTITDFILTDYKDVKEKFFLEIPVPLSFTLPSCRHRHPDRLPVSQAFTHLAVLGWHWGGRCGISHHLLSRQQDDTICSKLKPHQLYRLNQGLWRDLILLLGGRGKGTLYVNNVHFIFWL